MSDQPIAISDVTHQVVFKTNEEGSEAAAVTSIGFECLSVKMTPFIDVQFDRSFAFAIQDIKTGTVLFAGTIGEPNEDVKPAPAAGPAPA